MTIEDGGRMPVAEAITAVLEAAGVRRMYAVPGESFLELLDAFESSASLSLVSTRHESGAAFMAEAEAKLTGVPAVAAGTRAVGAANLAIGVHTAMQDSTPMIVLLGQVKTAHLGREAFQEIDLPDFYGELTKWSATVTRADRVPELVAKAVVTATTGRPGPVLLALPSDVLAGHADVAEVRAAVARVRARRPRFGPAPEILAEIAERIDAAERPVLIVGGGARDMRAELAAFADSFGMGVYTAFRRQDVFPSGHQNYLGHLTLGADPATLGGLREADLLLVLATRLDEVTGQSYDCPAPGVDVIHVDVNADTVDVGTSWAVAADARTFVDGLLRIRRPARPRDWRRQREAQVRAAAPRRRPAAHGMDPAEVLEVMRRMLPADTIIASDAGNFSAFVHQYWPYDGPGTEVAPASGAMGYGVPAGVAAALVRPDRRVVAVCGDGGFLMTGQELETAVRYGVDLVVVVMRNGLYGTIAVHQMKSMGRTAGVAIGDVDVAAFARSLGAAGYSATSAAELEKALELAGEGGVCVVDVTIDADLISPRLRLSDLAASGDARAAAGFESAGPSGTGGINGSDPAMTDQIVTAVQVNRMTQTKGEGRHD